MQTDEQKIHEYASLLGKRGGMKTKMTKPADYYKKIGTYAAQVRWGKKTA